MKKGSLILSVWFLINALPGVGALLFIAVGKHAPAFQFLFNPEEISTLDARVIKTTDGVAIIANALIVCYCISSWFIVRRCLAKNEKWAFYVLALGIAIVQAASYWSDINFSGKNFLVINFSSIIFLLGLGLCGRELFFKKTN